MVRRPHDLVEKNPPSNDMLSDGEDCVFQDATEEWPIVPEKRRRLFQRRKKSSTIDDLEGMTPIPLDPLAFLTPSERPECSVEALEIPLRLLEEMGTQVYLDWVASSSTKPATVSTQQKRLMDDATIDGEPREYQRLLLQSALSQNTIVHLGTGYGKTLIALLLIKEKCQDWNTGKQAVFLVPSVALAIQQTLSLRANLPFTVETACYDASNSEEHRLKLQKAQILVATHGALLDLLMHYGDLFSMRRFNVLVIDECHYCAGNHAYAIIMRKFYHTLPEEDRPHVLGLTASPLVSLRDSHSDQDLESMLQTLEETLDSKLVSSEHLIPDSYRKRVAMEAVIEFDGSLRCLPPADNLPLHNSRFREFRQLQQLYQDLGPLPVSLYCSALVRELARNEFENETPQEYGAAIQHLKFLIQFCEQQCHSFSYQGRTDKLVALEEVLEVEIEHHGGAETVGLVFTDRRITAIALHNYFEWRQQNREKEQAKYLWGQSAELRRGPPLAETIIDIPLVDVKEEDNDDDDIFADSEDDPFLELHETNVTDTREPSPSTVDQFMDADDDDFEEVYTPMPLQHSVVPQHKPYTSIRSIALVRNVTNIFNSLSKAKAPTNTSTEAAQAWLHVNHKVREVLTKLRRKTLNLLFATSVVEEGVDVQACSVVVVFDSIRSTKSYVQMKGRARKQNAKFYVFEDRLDKKNKSILPLASAQDMERRLQEFIESKTNQLAPKNELIEISNDDPFLEPEIAALRQGFFKSENAIVDLLSAKSLLNRYSMSVPLDPFVRLSKETLIAHMPDFRENMLILPSHLPGRIRTVVLPEEYHDKPVGEKRKMLSLMACVRLHSYGLLNNRLLPLTRSDMHDNIRRATTNRTMDVKPSIQPLAIFYDDCEIRPIFVQTIQHESETFSKFEQIFHGQGHRLGLITFERTLHGIPSLVIPHKEFGPVTTTFAPCIQATCDKEQMNLLREMFLLLMNERWRRHSRNMNFRLRNQDTYRSPFMPYLIGIISKEGVLDWDFMRDILIESKRSSDERKNAVESLSTTMPLTIPRLWTSIKDSHACYVAYGPANEVASAAFPVEKAGVTTFQDYFEKYRQIIIPAKDQLFDVQRYWSQPSTFIDDYKNNADETAKIKTNEAKYAMCPELPAIKVPQSACLEATIANAHVGLLTCFLPQIFFSYERYQTVYAFIKHCKENFPTLGSCLSHLPVDTVANALTAKSCGMNVSYEKLEWFGDAVLKMIQTESLLKSVEMKEWIQLLHEGDLSMLRQEMGCNKKLVQVCHQCGFERYILSSPLERGKWLPSCLDFTEDTFVPDEIRNGQKMFADIIESLLGLVYLESDYPTAMAVGDELNVTVTWAEPPLETPSGQSNLDTHLLENVQRATGYGEFRRPELLEEALSHPSASNPDVSSYERLEWIGDAVLCLTARRWIWSNFYDLDLSDMVTMESAIVSNEVLSFLSIHTGLHRFLDHKDHTLPSRMESYILSIQDDGVGLWGTDPPKCIADIVESLFGAIYMDSDLPHGIAAVENVLEPMCTSLLKLKEERQVIQLIHPKKALQELVGGVLSLETTWESNYANQHESASVLDGNTWRMVDPLSNYVVGYVHFMDHILVAVSDASATVARNTACAIAVQALQRNPHILKRLEDARYKLESAKCSKVITKGKKVPDQLDAFMEDADAATDLALLL